MRTAIIILTAVWAGAALAQDASGPEVVDQTIAADAFSFTGTREGPPVIVEVVDQTVAAAAFSFTGTRESPPLVIEVVDQTIPAGAFSFTGTRETP